MSEIGSKKIFEEIKKQIENTRKNIKDYKRETNFETIFNEKGKAILHI